MTGHTTHFHASVQRHIGDGGTLVADTGPPLTREQARAFIGSSLKAVGEQIRTRQAAVFGHADNPWLNAARTWDSDPGCTLIKVNRRTYLVVGCTCPPEDTARLPYENDGAGVIGQLNVRLLGETRLAMAARDRNTPR